MVSAVSPDRPNRLIGQVLIEHGLITPDQLDAALSAQRREGGRIGRHLILSGAISRVVLYRTLAE